MGREKTEMRKHGWVLEMTKYSLRGGPGDYYQKSGRGYCGSLDSASVFFIRQGARDMRSSFDCTDTRQGEIARKVELDENGVAVKVIPGR